MTNKTVNFLILSAIILMIQSCINDPQIDDIDLNQGWKFRRVGDQDYQKASVPGLVHLDLLNAGKIPEPFYRSNEDSLQWIGNQSWEYFNEFEFGRPPSKQRTELVFEGLDTYADVYLNDSLLLQTDNMFRKWVVEITKLLRPKNRLRIIFHSPIKKNAELESELGFPLPEQRAFTRKAPYQFGWDWGPKFVSCGIWKPVYLQVKNQSKILSTYYKTDHINESEAFLTAEVEIQTAYSQSVILSLLGNNQILHSDKLNLSPGKTNYTFNFKINDAKLWWTNGLGNPYLYKFHTQISCNQKVLDSKTETIGIRTLELKQEPDESGQSFFFELNGIPLFMKGANYIPQDNFLSRVDSSRYESLIRSAKEANMNMLRIWGGGIYENDLFYDLCDKNGILIWQDFMFAGSMYPGDDHFIENCQIEATEQILRLRNHPSIALWCGNNEVDEAWNNWGWQQQFNYTAEQQADLWNIYERLFHETLPDVLKRYDPNRSYWPSSPKTGWGHIESLYKGDSHYWGVWWGREPFSVYNEKVGRFMSEYGFQGFPDISTLDSVLLNEDKHLVSEALRTHQKHPLGFEIINEYMEREYLIPENFEDYLYVSQLLQAKGVGTALEAHRRAKPYCMGSLYWQLNDCWPVISWSSLDYYGNWKALHYEAKKAFDNLLISFEEKNGLISVYVISDLQERLYKSLKLELCDFNGEILWSDQLQIEIKPNSSENFYQVTKKKLHQKFDPNKIVLKASIMKNDETEIDRLFYFSTVKSLELADTEIQFECAEIEEGYEIILQTDKLAKNIYLSFPDHNGRFSDNYFDLLPGRKKHLTFITDQIIENPEQQLMVKSLIDCY